MAKTKLQGSTETESRTFTEMSCRLINVSLTANSLRNSCYRFARQWIWWSKVGLTSYLGVDGVIILDYKDCLTLGTEIIWLRKCPEAGSSGHDNETSCSIKGGECIDLLGEHQLFKTSRFLCELQAMAYKSVSHILHRAGSRFSAEFKLKGIASPCSSLAVALVACPPPWHYKDYAHRQLSTQFRCMPQYWKCLLGTEAETGVLGNYFRIPNLLSNPSKPNGNYTYHSF